MSLNLFPGCLQFNNRNLKNTLIDKNGGKSRYLVCNRRNNELDCYKIDNCVRNQIEKCDFLLIDMTFNQAFLIELKGSNISKAISQINSSLDLILPSIRNYAIHGRIVLTKVHAPSIRSSEYIRLKKRLKTLGGTIDQGSNNYYEEII